jgi:hypothetical protein
VAELTSAAALLGDGVSVRRTALAPFMVVVSRTTQVPAAMPTIERGSKMFTELAPTQQSEFRALSRWFGLAGLPLPFELH